MAGSKTDPPYVGTKEPILTVELPWPRRPEIGVCVADILVRCVSFSRRSGLWRSRHLLFVGQARLRASTAWWPDNVQGKMAGSKTDPPYKRLLHCQRVQICLGLCAVRGFSIGGDASQAVNGARDLGRVSGDLCDSEICFG